MGFVIDTSIFISAARGRFALESLAKELPGETMVIAAITASELLHGVYRTQDPQMVERRLAFVNYVLDLFPVIDFGLTIARQHAAIWATLEMQGQIIGAHDLLIAATARTLTYGVITTNEREFRRVTDLVVLNPL